MLFFSDIAPLKEIWHVFSELTPMPGDDRLLWS